jgi:hypothetical protein
VLRDIDDLSRSLTLHIRAETPSYDVYPLAEHRKAITESMSMLLRAVPAHAEPTAEELHWTRMAARRRAQCGVPVQDVLKGLHIGTRVLWDALREMTADPRDAEALLEAMGLLGLWIQAWSTAVTDAYTEETGVRHGRIVSLRHRLLEALRGGVTTVEQAAEFARELGFDPDGRFQACCSPAEVWPQEQIDLLQHALEPIAGIVHCGVRGDVMVVLVQSMDIAEVSAAIAELAGEHVRLGIGLQRERLAGADTSITDAERALSVARARGGGAVGFDDAWHAATLAISREQLEPLLAPGHEMARRHPELADTVMAFFESGFSLAGTAETLIVHPNTVVYRLNRWRELTGWDPRRLQGLLLSVASITVPGTE